MLSRFEGYDRWRGSFGHPLCQWRSKKGPPRRCKKGPLGGCGLVDRSPREGPARDAACPQQADAAARAGGTCGPTGSSVGWVVGSVSSRGLTPAALVEPVAVTVHLEDVDVVGERDRGARR